MTDPKRLSKAREAKIRGFLGCGVDFCDEDVTHLLGEIDALRSEKVEYDRLLSSGVVIPSEEYVSQIKEREQLRSDLLNSREQLLTAQRERDEARADLEASEKYGRSKEDVEFIGRLADEVDRKKKESSLWESEYINAAKERDKYKAALEGIIDASGPDDGWGDMLKIAHKAIGLGEKE